MKPEHCREYRVSIRFHGELNDFLRNQPYGAVLDHSFSGRRSVKDLIESVGVPHPEIDLILINDHPSEFDRIVQNGDEISVYPAFSFFGISQVSMLRGAPLKEIRFVLDVHLGTLARRLKLLGFSTDYSQERDDPELAEISAAEQKILLTCDRRLLMRKKITWGVLIRNSDPFQQTVEIMDRLDLWDEIRTFTRCISCNGHLYQVIDNSKEYQSIIKQLPTGVTCWCKEYVRCDRCRKIYWKGSHFDKMEKLLAELLKQKRT